VTIENDGDIELDTGTGANARVLTTADIFVQGNTQGLLAQLTSLANRVNQLETKLAALEAERPLSADSVVIVDTFDTADCDLQGWLAYNYPLYGEKTQADVGCNPCGDLGYMLGGKIPSVSKAPTYMEKTYTALPRHTALRLTFGLTMISTYQTYDLPDSSRKLTSSDNTGRRADRSPC
jgi:hypothetical protein